MNPKYPMGRSDYFWASMGLLLITLPPFLITCFWIVFIGSVIGGPDFTIDALPSWWAEAALLPWLLICIPVEYRRCKAAAIPYQIIWITYGISVVDTFAYQDDFSALRIVSAGLSLWIWLAPNRMDVVRKKPVAGT